MKKAYPYIRWSSKKQEEGDSERRQTELITQSKEWLKALGYELDESMNLIDKGESAFTSTPPALARFLKAVKNGEVKPGSMLMAESFDRLNRNNPEDAMRQFLDLKGDGISIGILNNWKVYKPGQPWTELLLPLVESGRSYEESDRKRNFQKAFWVKVRLKAIKGERSKHKCPYWLSWNEETKQYVQIPKAVEAVRHVYERKLQGWGSIRISKEMNQLKIWMPPISKGNATGMWTSSYVVRCLRNETPIGTFAPHLRIKEKQPDGKVKIRRDPACDPIPNYYPSIFKEDEEHIFYEVQRIMNLTGSLPGKGGGGGRNNKASNVFKGIIRCGLCNGQVSYVDKTGKASKSPKEYLQCGKAREKHECTAPPINYNEFLELFFHNLQELTVQDILPAPKEQEDHIKELELAITVGNKNLKTLETKAESFLKAIEISKDDRNRAMYDKRLTDANNEIERVTKEVKHAEDDLNSAKQDSKTLQVRLNTSNDLYHKLCDMPEGPEKVEFRSRILSELRELIDHIVIYPIPRPEEFKIDLENSEGAYEVLESGLVRTMTKHVRIVFRASSRTTIAKTIFLKQVWEI